MSETGPEELASRQADLLSLEILADQLQLDLQECWRAYEGLESIDTESRIRIIEGMADVAPSQGVTSLLRLLVGSHDGATRTAASRALAELGERVHGVEGDPEVAAYHPPDTVDPARTIVRAEATRHPRLVGSLVTIVDGEGRGTIAVSSCLGNERRTAVFLCQVLQGIVDVVGQVEEDGPAAGRLLEEIRDAAAGRGALEAPGLALRLLAGSLAMSGPAQAALPREWLDQTLGSEFRPRLLPAANQDRGQPRLTPEELQALAGEMLDLCPDWLDRSPLTFELAEEIWLREGRTATDPIRDAGAFRYLFQHRLIDRLELYRRMLLWMGWFWSYGDEPELARGASVLAGELSDEQHAVPAHPFAVVFMARSLDAAGAGLGTRADPRLAGRIG
jgi:hypothetical protein